MTAFCEGQGIILPRFVDSEVIFNASCEFLTDKMTCLTHRDITKVVEEFR